jgi:hypothetical protein
LRLNREWEELRKSDQYEGLRSKLLQNMHRAVRLSGADGTNMIKYYGYDGVYKKLMGSQKSKEEERNNRG